MIIHSDMMVAEGWPYAQVYYFPFFDNNKPSATTFSLFSSWNISALQRAGEHCRKFGSVQMYSTECKLINQGKFYMKAGFNEGSASWYEPCWPFQHSSAVMQIRCKYHT